MKTEHKYYVEWTVDDFLHKKEIVLSVELPLMERFPYIKDYVTKYWTRITKKGTRVEVRKVEYKGTILRIEKDNFL